MKDFHRLYPNTSPFYLRDLSIGQLLTDIENNCVEHIQILFQRISYKSQTLMWVLEYVGLV